MSSLMSVQACPSAQVESTHRAEEEKRRRGFRGGKDDEREATLCCVGLRWLESSLLQPTAEVVFKATARRGN